MALVCLVITGSVSGQETQVALVTEAQATASPNDYPLFTPSNTHCCLEPCDTLAICGWFADFGLNVLQPRWATNQALAVQTPLFGAPATNTAVEFKYGFNASPFINLGYVGNNGLGVRMGYWDFRGGATANATPGGGGAGASSAGPLGVPVFGVGNPMQANTSLKFQVWDCELMQQLGGGGWLWNLSGGVRYLHMNQTYNVTTSGAAGTVDDLASNHSLNAAGPTAALTGRTQLGSSYFSLYGTARESVVFGDNAQQAHTFSASGTQGTSAFQSSRSFANITELNVGVAYQRSFAPVTVVASTGLVGQYWGNVGNAANTDTFIASANDESQNNTLGMGLFGAQAMLQLRY